MAIPSDRSPSPLPSRPRTPSVSEPHSATRRSFSATPSPKPLPLSNTGRSFCPTTPSDSPAGFVRRCLLAKDETTESWDCSEKENERAAKLGSPAKGSKNFMSPTISAASKFSPSPKKKVLVERNEPVRTSISLCDGKATFFSSISSDSTENSKPKTEIPPDAKSLRKVTFSEAPLHYDDETVVTDSDPFSNETTSKNTSSCSNLSPSTTTQVPSLSPYDPLRSYRPQFLVHKPKPRFKGLKSMERGFDVVGEPKQPDESFTSAIVSEDSDSESPIEDSRKESDDSSSTTEEEMVVEEEPKSLEEERVLKPEAEDSAKEIPEGNKKSRFFICLKWAFTVFLLMIAACVSISVTDSPVSNGYGVKDLNLADLSYWGSRVQSTLSDHFRKCSIPSSLSTDELSPMFFTNSTCLIRGSELEFKVERVFEKLEELQDHESDDEAESEDLVKEDDVEEEADSDFEEALEDDDDVPETELGGGKVEVEDLADEDVGSAEEDEILAIDVQSEEVHTDFADTIEISVLEVIDDDVVVELDSPISEVLKPEEEEEAPTQLDDNRKISALEAAGEEELDVGIDDHLENISEDKDGSCSEESSASQMQQEEGNGFNKPLGISSSPLLLISAVAVAASTAAAFIFVRQNNVASRAEHQQQSMTIGKEEQQETVVDVGAAAPDSGPSSEVSTSCNSKTRRRGRRMAGEAKSEEEEEKRKARRESVATSDYSLGTLSYGSFTTYERIPVKHHHLGNGGGEEEITPVRRSSRIRSQVTSPS